MNNIIKVTNTGMCTGCAACAGCEHIIFLANALGFPVPVVDGTCNDCGECLKKCIFYNEA